ncbi:MAG: hypothetical protein II350_10180, partial [Clostridia bacterium]|nr:hypothetical protein [Clostridia bacterium]
NETEDMLDYICLHASDTFVSELAQYGIYHLQPMARWQIAELIGRRKPLRWKDMLYVLIEDHDEYVVKRAKNAICYP